MQNHIRRWREERGLSQEALGRRIGVSKATVSKLERGVLSLRDTTIARLVEALDVSAEALLGDYAVAARDLEPGPAAGAAPKAPVEAPGAAGEATGTEPGSDTPGETYFGFRKVPVDEKSRLVGDVFTSVARRYDLMNDLMSGGVHRLWKREMVDWLRPRPGLRVADIAGGTGDVALRILERTHGEARVVVCDASRAMVEVGRDRALDRGVCAGIDWLCGDAEDLPLADGSMDACTIAFGIRNVSRIDRALGEVRRVLKPGGRFLCLEFSRVTLPGLGVLYDAYSFNLLPALGAVVAGDADAYRYLVESIRRFPDQESFAGMIEAAGMANVRWRDLSGGIAALHSAWRI